MEPPPDYLGSPAAPSAFLRVRSPRNAPSTACSFLWTRRGWCEEGTRDQLLRLDSTVLFWISATKLLIRGRAIEGQRLLARERLSQTFDEFWFSLTFMHVVHRQGRPALLPKFRGKHRACWCPRRCRTNGTHARDAVQVLLQKCLQSGSPCAKQKKQVCVLRCHVPSEAEAPSACNTKHDPRSTAVSHRARPTPCRRQNRSGDADDQHRPATRASQRPSSQQLPRRRSCFSPRRCRFWALLTIALVMDLGVVDGSTILRAVAQGLPLLSSRGRRRGGDG